MTTLVVLLSFGSMGLLVFHHKDTNPHKETNHQQNGCDSCDYNCVHIHDYISCTCET